MKASRSRRQPQVARLRIILVSIIIIVAAGLLSFGALGMIFVHRETHQQKPVITATTITYSTDTPAETPPVEACEQYVVASNEPRMIEIPSVGVKGCIQRVGVDQHNAIAVPDNIHLAGWYTGSPVPGNDGVSIIDGHVLGRYNDAIFTQLHDLVDGQTIRIQYGDLSWKEFRVISSDSYQVNDVMPYLLEQVADQQLNLITCSGTFDGQARTYDERLVVRAVLVAE